MSRSFSALYCNSVAAGDVRLGVQQQYVSCPETGGAFGDQHPVAALDHDDDGLARDVEIADALPVPRAVLQQDDLLEVDGHVVAQRLRAQHNGVALLEHQIAAGRSPLPGGSPSE